MKKKSQSAGFSLVEVVVAVGIMGLAGYFLTSMLSNGSKGQKTLLAQDDARSFGDNIVSLLATPAACEYTFGDGHPAAHPPLPSPIAANAASGTSITTIYDANMKAQYVVGKVYGNRGLSLNGITIGGSGTDLKTGKPQWTSTGTGTGIAFVQLDWLQTGNPGNQGTGPQHLYRFFWVDVETMSGSNISTCVSESGGSGGGYWTLNGNSIYNNNDTGLGSVGIGTSAPFANFQVRAGADHNYLVRGPLPPTVTGIEIGSVNDANNTWEPLQIDGSLTLLGLAPPGYVGIGTTNPTVALDVNGGLRAGSSAAVTACGLGAAAGEGTQRYNYGTHQMEYCNGTGWVGAGGGYNGPLYKCSCSSVGAYDLRNVLFPYDKQAAGECCGYGNGGACPAPNPSIMAGFYNKWTCTQIWP